MFDTSSSTRSADHSVMGLSSNVFYVVVFVAVGVAILAVVAMRRRTAVKEELRHSSSFSFDDAVGSEKSKSIFSTKSPYIAEVAADTIEKGMEKAGSFIRGSSFGYSDVSGEKDSFFGMESPIVTAQKEEEIEMMKPSNFSYEDMTGKDSMFEMQSPLETAKEEELLELEKPSNFSYDDMVRQPSLVDTMENSLHLASKEEAQALVVKDEGNFGVQNEEMNI